MHRLDLGLYSQPKEVFLGMESEPMLTPREKSPLSEKFSSEEDGTHDTASLRTASPTHYQRAVLALHSQTVLLKDCSALRNGILVDRTDVGSSITSELTVSMRCLL